MAAHHRDERLQIMLSPAELAAVDDFRYKHRIPSRAAAVRELLQVGLAAASKITDGDGRKSSEFGVFGRGPNSHAGTASSESLHTKKAMPPLINSAAQNPEQDGSED